jgi:ribosomal RNA assembly protein
MEVLFVPRIREIARDKEMLEKELNVSIAIAGKKVTLEGEAINEYEARDIIDAIGLGFPVKKALMLKEGELLFKKISIKDFTRRKDMHEVRSRIIGREGKIKRTIEDVSDCDIVLQDNDLGIIGSAEDIMTAVTALTNLIRGTKAANVYSFLERANADKKKFRD